MFRKMRLFPSLSQFFKRNDGAIAIMFAFFLLPFILVMSIGIEVGRLIYVETRMAYAIDAAVVSVARYDLNDAQANMENMFYVNLERDFMGMDLVPTFEITENNTKITISVEGDMPTILGKFVGINSLHANASATSLRTLVGVEIAMILDTTGSMLSNNKIGGLKVAAKNFIDVIFQDEETRPNTLIGIIPYAMTVNVGSDKTGWLTDPATAANPVFFPAGAPWKGCVKNRDITLGSLSDTPPTQITDKFETYYAESSYTFHAWWQAWDNDYTIRSDGTIRVRNSFSYANIGPNLNCVDPLQIPINNKTSLKSKIDSLDVYMGGTDGSRIVWGWRMLSPKWNGLWGAQPMKEYGASNNIKAIIMMTDGENSVPSRNYTGVAVTAYEPRSNPAIIGNNRLSTGRMYGASTRSQANTQINAAMAEACTKIKDAGIEIYTVVLQVNDETTQNLYRNCATSQNHYYAPGNTSELYEDFEKIAKSLNRIRIIK